MFGCNQDNTRLISENYGETTTFKIHSNGTTWFVTEKPDPDLFPGMYCWKTDDKTECHPREKVFITIASQITFDNSEEEVPWWITFLLCAVLVGLSGMGLTVMFLG